MAAVSIPLANTSASQRLACVLQGLDSNGNSVPQQCVIYLRELVAGKQYMSLSVAGVSVCDNVLLNVNTPLVQAAYSGLLGDFAVIDLTGANEHPQYSGWGTRWLLLFNPAA